MPLRILLVDGHAESRYALSKLLAFAGHDVAAATAAAVLRESAPVPGGGVAAAFDLLICDIDLPNLAGLALMRHAQAAWGAPGIALTTDDEEPADPIWRAAGYVVRLRKPLRFREVESAIRRALAQRPRRQAPTTRPAGGAA